MTALSPHLAASISKIVGRLASDHDGEIVAAAGAIRRTLAAAGHDLNDLAQHIAAPAPPPEAGERKTASVRTPEPEGCYGWRESYRQVRPGPHHKQTIRWCRRFEGCLSAWERDFLDNLAVRVDLGQSLTSRQAAVLQDIGRRMGAFG